MATRRERERASARRSSAKAWAEKADQGGQRDKSLKLPDGVETFYPKKAGTYELDIVPYIVSDRAEEFDGDIRNADPGMEHFERTYFVHKNVGPKEETHTCPTETFGERCPICERRNRERDNDELYKLLKPQKRMLWRVRVVSGPEQADDKKVRVWNTTFWKGFGELLREEVVALRDPEMFADMQNGYRVSVRLKEDSFNGRKYLAVSKVDLHRRDEPIPAKMLDAEPCLDDVVVKIGYDALAAIYEGEAPDDEERADRNGDDEDDRPTRGKTSQSGSSRSASTRSRGDDDEPRASNRREPDDEPEEDEDRDRTAAFFGLEVGDKVEYEGEECEIVKISGDGTSLTLEDDGGKLIKAVDPADVEKVDGDEPEDDEPEDDEDEERPAARKPGKGSRKPSDEDEDEPEDEDASDLEDEDEPEEDEDEEDEKPARKPAKKPARRR